jgi:hypothetical protein
MHVILERSVLLGKITKFSVAIAASSGQSQAKTHPEIELHKGDEPLWNRRESFLAAHGSPIGFGEFSHELDRDRKPRTINPIDKCKVIICSCAVI